MAEEFHDDWSIRVATPDDAAQIVHIYAPYVTDTVVTFETAVPSVETYRQRIVNTLARYPFLVACTSAGRIIGYAYAGAFKPRAAYDWTVETTVYLRPEAQGRGVSHALYDRLEELLVRQGVTTVCACIAVPNPASGAFHAKRGFAEVAHFTHCGYKLGIWLDMVWMEKNIAPYPEHPDPIIAFPDLNIE